MAVAVAVAVAWRGVAWRGGRDGTGGTERIGELEKELRRIRERIEGGHRKLRN